MTTGANEPGRGIGGISRPAARLAWSLWALVVTLTTLSLLLLVLNRSHPNAPTFEWWLGNTTVVVDATVGAIVASRRPENPVGWLLCLAGVTVSATVSIDRTDDDVWRKYAFWPRAGPCPRRRNVLREGLATPVGRVWTPNAFPSIARLASRSLKHTPPGIASSAARPLEACGGWRRSSRRRGLARP